MHREEPPRTLIPAEGEYVPRTGPASTAPSRQFIPAAPPSYPPPQREASRTDFPPAAPRRPSSGQVPIGFSEPPTARSSVEIDRIRRSGFVKRHEPDILSSQHPDSGARKVVSSAPEAAYDQQGKLEYVTYTFNKVDFDRRKRND